MAKAKTPKKEKGTLPITKGEFDNAILVGSFVSIFKRYFEKNKDVTEYHFVPMIHGYQVLFTEKGKECKVDIKKRKYLGGCRVTKYVDGFKKASCITKSMEENEAVVRKLMENSKTKRGNKRV